MSANKLMICLVKLQFQISREKFEPGAGFETQTSRLVLYYFSYPGSIYCTGLNLSPESNTRQGTMVCDTAIN